MFAFDDLRGPKSRHNNINAKIEKVIASRLKNYGTVNVPQVALLFAAVLGAMLMGYLIIRLVAK